MHAGERADRRVVLDRDVTGERCGVGENRLVPDMAVMRDVRVGHEEIVVADLGDSSTAGRAAMDRDELSNDVAAADLEPRQLAAELQVLRDQADGGHRENLVFVADLGEAVDDRGGADVAVAPDPHVLADDHVRPDPGSGTDASARMHDRRRIDERTVRDRGLPIDEPHDEFGFGDHAVVHVRHGGGADDPATAGAEGDLEAQAIAGDDLSSELGVVDAAKEDAVAVGSLGAVREQHSSDVRERLDHEYAWHHGSPGEMPLEEIFVD